MRRVVRGLAVTALALAALLTVLGFAAWPPGGLMFALPYLLLAPAAILGVVGGGALWLTRPRRRPAPPDHPAG
jgi:hypothetical protein